MSYDRDLIKEASCEKRGAWARTIRFEDNALVCERRGAWA
jgi:hypothetical protein